jgi:myosin heavy subunit
MQIQYNITRIEEWCKSHDMPEGTLQLEHLMQATKLLQLKKVDDFLNTFYHRAHQNCLGDGRRYRDHLRCLLDAESNANPTHVYKLLRC